MGLRTHFLQAFWPRPELDVLLANKRITKLQTDCFFCPWKCKPNKLNSPGDIRKSLHLRSLDYSTQDVQFQNLAKFLIPKSTWAVDWLEERKYNRKQITNGNEIPD